MMTTVITAPSRVSVIAQARADTLADLCVTQVEVAQAWILDIPLSDYICARMAGTSHHEIIHIHIHDSKRELT